MANKVAQIPDGMTNDQYKELKEAFSVIDRDGDGEITTNELKVVLQSMGLTKVTETEIAQMISDVDTDRNGTVNFSEFLTMMHKKMRTADEEQEIRAAFNVFDKNGDGMISAAELRHVLTNLGEKLSDEDVEDMIRTADANKDGFVDWNEFVVLLKDIQK
eukprot:TRINITY_DN6693_c0_g1_i1.p2 TRINITY_DN6693_c0_g1~~TRINITY_DN6693_c0_g1_i1.p2  ORF type:complete len:185 (+),score=81.30 TRINITY_DN6693_c0_g1_i1:78-557(+)